MNGAECLLRTLVDASVDLCFMNPGTSEMQFVSALDRVPAMHGVLCLFEGVCSGAADGYARMTGRPAATLLHLGPGLANGLANFHNARKARSPVVNIVGEHSTLHLAYDAPLTADTALFARTVSGWVRVLESAEQMGAAASEAVAAAIQLPGQVATLIVPADFSWSEAGAPGAAPPKPVPVAPDAARVAEAARILRGPQPAGLLLGGRALLAPALAAAGRLGVRVLANRYAARMERGADLFAPLRLPYFPEPAEEALAGLKHLILVESPEPVTFFGYPGRRGSPAPVGCQFHVLAAEGEGGTAALQTLAGRGADAPRRVARACLPSDDARLTPETVGMAVGALLPEGAIVSDEMVSSGEQVWPHLAGAPRHDHLPVTGGSIGQGLPVALGAALACPRRKVIALEADGSGLYTPQSLWTMARERADVVVVIFANRRYRILDIEMRRTGAGAPGPRANDMIDIGRPDPDWVRLAEGLGVAASRAATPGQFIGQFREAVRERGPRLIEAVIED
jgi:acetolactate synthase-1/2/3 large subunit